MVDVVALTCLMTIPPKLWPMNTIGRFESFNSCVSTSNRARGKQVHVGIKKATRTSASPSRLSLSALRSWPALSGTPYPDVLPTTLASYWNVITRAYGIFSGRRSCSQKMLVGSLVPGLPWCVHDLMQWPFRPWTATMLFISNHH